MAFTALKPCRFGGVLYEQGDVISDSTVDKNMVRKLVASGKIRPVKGGAGVAFHEQSGGKSAGETANYGNDASEAEDGLEAVSGVDTGVASEAVSGVAGESEAAEKGSKKTGKK